MAAARKIQHLTQRHTAEALRRAKEHGGPDRDRLLLLGKSALACIIAWALAEYAVDSPEPTYAPFTGLLVVQTTAYRSVVHSLQFVGAVLIGVLAAGAAGPALGVNIAAFAAMLVVALGIGRWHQLRTQGIQVPVAAIFAYEAVTTGPMSTLLDIAAMALLGAGVGVAVSLFVVPPLQYRAADDGVEQASYSLCALLEEIAGRLREGLPEEHETSDWLRRARQLDPTMSQARHAIEAGAESVVYNPRRLLPRRTPTTFHGYRTLIDSLARAAEQARSICYGLLRAVETPPHPRPDMLRAYAEVLDALSRTVGDLGALGEGGDGAGPVHQSLEVARERQRELTVFKEGTDAWEGHLVLITDTDRLLEELTYAHEQGAIHPSSPASPPAS